MPCFFMLNNDENPDIECQSPSRWQHRSYAGCGQARSRSGRGASFYGERVIPPRDDDAQRILQLIEACDVLLIGSPCYWGNMPGTLKVLFDRMVYGLMGESPRGMPRPLHKGKRAILITACTTPWPFNVWFRQSRGTVRALREILRWSGFRVVKSIERGGTKTRPLTERDLEKCRRAVRKL